MLEIVINGLDEASVMKAMGVAVKAATKFEGIKWITAVNFDGKLGKFQMSLKESVESA